MSMCLLPTEIYEKIFSYICDTETYKNVRLSNKLFYNILKNLNHYDNNGELLRIYIFSKDSINILNKNNEEIGSVKIKHPCVLHYSLQENNTKSEKIYNPREIVSIKTEKREFLTIKTCEIYNIKSKKHTKKTETFYINNHFDNIGVYPPCIIS